MMEAITLSSWDHIMGPQIQKLWFFNSLSDYGTMSDISSDILIDFNNFKHEPNYESRNSHMELKMYSDICGQLMLGEVVSCKPFNEYASRFYVLENKVVVAVVVRLKTFISLLSPVKKTSDSCLCIAAVYSYEVLDFILDKQGFIDMQLRRAISLVDTFGLFQGPVMTNLNIIANEVAHLMTYLDEYNCCRLQTPNLPLQELINWEIACLAIVSHFKTAGCSIVLGSSDFKISQVVNILSYFNYETKPHCTLSYPQTSKLFVQGIHIKHSVKDTKKESEQLLEQASKELFSLTVIDVDFGYVYQTIPVKDSNTSYKNLTRLEKDKGILVPDMLNDLEFILKTSGDSNFKSFSTAFCNYLIGEATALINIMEESSCCKSPLTASQFQSMLGLLCVTDLQIIIGCAERMKPGIRSCVSL